MMTGPPPAPNSDLLQDVCWVVNLLLATLTEMLGEQSLS